MYPNNPADDAPRLLVAAASPLSRAGLASLLEERGCNVLAQADGKALGRAIERHQPDALIVDLGWPADAMRAQLSQIESDIPVLALTDEDERARIAPLLAMLSVFPQFALLRRDCHPDIIVAAVEALAGGLTVLDPRLSVALTQAAAAMPEPPQNPLSAREAEVLQLLAQGLTNRAIALELDITQHTVKFHVNAIMSKLGAQSRTEAVVRATRLGLIVL